MPRAGAKSATARRDEVRWDGEEWWAKLWRKYADTAYVRALHLLVTHLTPLEREMFTEFQRIPVVDTKGILWVLKYHNAPSGSAYVLGHGTTCWYPKDNGYYGEHLPAGDVILGQKYALESGLYYTTWPGRDRIDPASQRTWLRIHHPEWVKYFPE